MNVSGAKRKGERDFFQSSRVKEAKEMRSTRKAAVRGSIGDNAGVGTRFGQGNYRVVQRDFNQKWCVSPWQRGSTIHVKTQNYKSN